jgi:hypothetical protein
MRTLKNIHDDLQALSQEAARLELAAKIEKMEHDALAIVKAVEEADHKKKSAAFVEYEKSRAYVEGIRKDVEKSGTVAVSTYDGSKITFKRLEGNSYRTFDNLRAGQTVEIGTTLHLVKSFDHDFAGSQAELLPLTHIFRIIGRKSTPYDKTPCNLSGNRMIVPNYSKLNPSDILEINGKQYIPSAIYTTSKFYAEYELSEVV